MLQIGEQLVVTGHSLGGHLAILFGRLFPTIAQEIYTYNAPGVGAWGNVLLNAAGVGASDPSRVVNVVASYGLDVASAFGTRPGKTYKVFIEGGDPVYNHAIVRLTDSLALHDVVAKLSPGLAERIDEISSILAASSRKPVDSLEATLDMLRRLVGIAESPTPIALAETGQANRDVYYTRLYDLRDTYADGHDWGISSLAGLSAMELRTRAEEDVSYRYALAELMPFAAAGGSFDPSLQALSSRWLAARSNFLSGLLEARTADRMFGLSGTDRNSLFVDVDHDETLAILSPVAALVAQNQGSDERLAAYLADVSYAQKTMFGSDDAAHPDALAGSSGADLLFGNGGDDILTGGAGDDVLIGGAGSDVLDGGIGFDTYVFESALDADVIRDSDGRGAVELARSPLVGGYLRRDGRYISADGLHLYELSGEQLTIDGLLKIEGFRNDDLGISLSGVPRLKAEAPEAVFTYVGDQELVALTPGAVVNDEYFNRISSGTPSPGVTDIFYGRPGNTAFYTGDGNDYVREWYGGDDTLRLGSGMDLGFGGDGADWIEGGPDRDMLLGGRGNDVLIAESMDVDIDLPPAPRSFNSQMDPVAQHLLSGGRGDDVVIGSGESDLLEGGPGADLLIGGAGDDAILGDGIPISYVAQEDGEPLVVTLPSGTFLAPNLAISDEVFTLPEEHSPIVIPVIGVRSVWVPFFDVPDAGGDEIHAGPGNDFVIAGGGNDVAHGGTGNDKIDGGRGSDELHGDDGADILYGDAAPDWYVSSSFDPETEGGDDRLYGDAGTDSIFGQGGNDTLAGGAGDDLLDGGQGSDILIGGYGADSLHGGPGADVLDGGPESDTYFVGNGDTVVIRLGEANDAIEPDGAFPTAASIAFSQGLGPDDVTVMTISMPPPFPSWWVLRLEPTGERIEFQGSRSDWAGITFRFSDGSTRSLTDLPLREQRFEELIGTHAPFGTSASDRFVGTTGPDHFAGGAGDDYYYLKGRGRDRIDDSSGNDTVFLDGVQSSDATIYSTGDDYLLRYPGGELRLIGQAHADAGVETLQFGADGATWARADLEARAQPLSESRAGTLGVRLATRGERFSFTLPEGTFSGEQPLGQTRYEVADIRGAPLPSWLSFDAETGVLSGTPGGGDATTTVLFGLRDGNEVIAVAPLVIAFEATPVPPDEPPVPSSSDEPASQQPLPSISVDRLPTPEPPPLVDTQIALVPTAIAPADVHLEAVGAIADAVYREIDSLLFAPASSHAPRFIERYEEAVREFRERYSPLQEESPEARITDDQMARYNESLHAWLDADERRIAALAVDQAWESGAIQTAWLGSGAGYERLLGNARDAFARPGLPALQPIQAQPGLTEGLSNLG